MDVPAKGRASYRSLRVRDRTAPDAAWVFEEPVADAAFLSGYISFEWGAIDEWFVEDEQLFGHPRDPYSRIDVFKSTRHESSPTRTRCAYKGSASYWHVRVGDRLVEDLVWTYRDPQHDAKPVADQLCFFNERVDLEVDGEPQDRPRTQWSRDED